MTTYFQPPQTKPGVQPPNHPHHFSPHPPPRSKQPPHRFHRVAPRPPAPWRRPRRMATLIFAHFGASAMGLVLRTQRPGANWREDGAVRRAERWQQFGWSLVVGASICLFQTCCATIKPLKPRHSRTPFQTNWKDHGIECLLLFEDEGSSKTMPNLKTRCSTIQEERVDAN